MGKNCRKFKFFEINRVDSPFNEDFKNINFFPERDSRKNERNRAITWASVCKSGGGAVDNLGREY